MNSVGQSKGIIGSGAMDALSIAIPAGADTSSIAVLTVTYHPDPERFARQVRRLPEDVLLVIVDNASTEVELGAVERSIGDRPHTHMLRNQTNVGLAAAINQAAAYIATLVPTREFLLLMDQDSVPESGTVAQLLHSFLHLEQQGRSVGCVGPRLVDGTTGLQHGFHRMRGWRWIRVFPEDSAVPIQCANLNGSGTLVRLSFFQRMHGLDETMFIDHVDTDWAFRVLAAGFEIYGIPQAIVDHRMGERGLRFWWFGWRIWPYRSPCRHYYLFRNAIWLMHQPYVPVVWKFWAVVKLALTMMLHALFDAQRGAQLRSMLAGIREGLVVARKHAE